MTFTRDMLDAMVRDDVPESLTLDYKRSEALKKDNSCRNELCKDVSAFANSAGGILVYGVVEAASLELDRGVDGRIITREWIEQVISSNIQPRISGITINQLEADNADMVYYILEIPPALSLAPHQAPDKKYYKRFNFQSVPMEDYEIRDVLRRSSTPSLKVECQFLDGLQELDLTFEESRNLGLPDPYSDRIYLESFLINTSPQPAEYTVLEFFVHPMLLATATKPFTSQVKSIDTPDRLMQMNVFSLRLGIPTHMPIFKEVPERVPGHIALQVTHRAAYGAYEITYPFGYRVRCPGFALEHWGLITISHLQIKLKIN